jgi:predicted RNA polymerase sigma factor
VLIYYREQNLQETEFRCHYCIGGVLMKIGLDAQAQNAFAKAVQVAQKSNRKFDEADALVQLGQVGEHDSITSLVVIDCFPFC